MVCWRRVRVWVNVSGAGRVTPTLLPAKTCILSHKRDQVGACHPSCCAGAAASQYKPKHRCDPGVVSSAILSVHPCVLPEHVYIYHLDCAALVHFTVCLGLLLPASVPPRRPCRIVAHVRLCLWTCLCMQDVGRICGCENMRYASVVCMYRRALTNCVFVNEAWAMLATHAMVSHAFALSNGHAAVCVCA